MTYRRRQWQPTPELLPGKSHGRRSLVGCSHGVARSGTRLCDFTFTFHFHALEKEMATHSSVLVWRIPGMGEPSGLPSLGSHRVGHDWSDLAAAAAAAWHIHGAQRWRHEHLLGETWFWLPQHVIGYYINSLTCRAFLIQMKLDRGDHIIQALEHGQIDAVLHCDSKTL